MRVRRFLNQAFIAAAILLAAVLPSRAFLFSGAGVLVAPPSGVVATHTIINTSGATLSSTPYQFGQVFARGDVPGCLTTNTPAVEDHTGAPLVYQIDEASDWDDGSCRHLVYSIFAPTIAAGTGSCPSSCEQLQIVKVVGSYTPGTDNRTTADITGSHDFQVQLTHVLDHANATVGSGAYTFDANTCINDGTTETYATGPVRHGVMVACAALDTAPSTTTLSGSVTNGATSLTVASAAGFPSTGNFIIKIDHEYLIVTGGQGTTTWIVTRGAARSTAGSHSSAATVTYVGNFYAFLYFDIYTDPTNPAAVYSIGHMPLVMQPWLNITSADFTSYRADYTDVGHGDVRNWAATATLVQNSTNISTANGTISIPTLSDQTVLQRSECVEFSSSGALPTTSPQIVAGQPYWVKLSTGTAYQIFPDSAGPSSSPGAGARLTISAVGSGTLTVTRRICQTDREAWFSASDDAGHENFTANAGAMEALYPALTQSECVYWEKTGLIPPYDCTLTPNAMTAFNGGQSDSSSYRPMIAVQTYNAIGAAGAPPGAAPLPMWDVVAFLRQDRTDWDFARAAALGHASMPWVASLQEATGHIQPWNGGASRFNASCVDSGTGTPYSILGTAEKDWMYGGLNQVGVVVPASGKPGAVPLSNGVWSVANGDGMDPSQGHWPLSPYMEYLFFGREWLLDLMYMDGNNTLMIRQVPSVYSFISKNKQIQINGTGPVYTAQYPFGNDRQSHSLGDMVMLSAFGSSSLHQERAYGNDVLQENICGMAATLANQTTGQDTLGLWDTSTGGGLDGLTTVWGSWGWIWAKAITRNSGFDTIVNRFATNMQTRWGEIPGGWSSFYGSVEYMTNFQQPQTAVISSTAYNGSWHTQFATSASQLGLTSPSGQGGATFSATAATPTVITTTISDDFHLQNGDQFECLNPAYNNATGPGSYTGPPECEPNNNPNGNLQWFTVCNVSGSGLTVTFNLGTDASCATLIGFSAAYTNQSYAFHPTATPPTSDCVLLSDGCTNWDPKGQYSYYFATINWLTSLGILTTGSATYTNVNARVQIPAATWQTNPSFDFKYQPVQ